MPIENRQRLEAAGRALFGPQWKRPTARLLRVDWHAFRKWGRDDGEPPEWAVEFLEYEQIRRREAAAFRPEE